MKTPKTTKPRRGKMQFITRTEARRRAERYILNRMFRGAAVRDGAEARLCLGYVPGPTSDRLKQDIWVVYKNPEDPLALKSASIIAVCKRTGRVLYEGSAGDEG